MGNRVYIYGVIGSDQENLFSSTSPPEIQAQRTDAKDDDGAQIYTIPYQDIACVVKNTDMDSLGSMEKAVLGRLLVEHQRTIETAMKDCTVIPFKFGTIVESDDEVKRVLERGYAEFKEKLRIMHRRIELDLVALWHDLDGVVRTIGEETEEIKKFKDDVAKRPPEESFQDRIKIGAMIKDALDEKRGNLQTEMLSFLKQRVADFQKHELMDDRMILNCAFLLHKDKESEFDEALNELNSRYDEKVDFRCVGPLPPYSFSTIEVKKVAYAEIDAARQLLGLNEEATIQEIKESYRKMSLKIHPDNDPEDPRLKKKFEDVAKAYKLLSNYCQGEKCSFKEAHGKDFLSVEMFKV